MKEKATCRAEGAPVRPVSGFVERGEFLSPQNLISPCVDGSDDYGGAGVAGYAAALVVIRIAQIGISCHLAPQQRVLTLCIDSEALWVEGHRCDPNACPLGE